jgi:hypothetical protein
MVRRILILILTAALAAGCSTYPDTTRQRMESLPQHYSNFDLQLAWDTNVVGGNTLVEGVVKNVRYAFMYELEIWVTVLDSAGKAVARSVDMVMPPRLNLDESAAFSMKLPMVVAPGTKLRFTYRYRGSDGGDGGIGSGRGSGDLIWWQSFDSVVPPK